MFFHAPFSADETLMTEFERCPTSDQLDLSEIRLISSPSVTYLHTLKSSFLFLVKILMVLNAMVNGPIGQTVFTSRLNGQILFSCVLIFGFLFTCANVRLPNDCNIQISSLHFSHLREHLTKTYNHHSFDHHLHLLGALVKGAVEENSNMFMLIH